MRSQDTVECLPVRCSVASDHAQKGKAAKVAGLQISQTLPRQTLLPKPQGCGKRSLDLKVFVLGPNKTPLMPCKPARARLLLDSKQAAVFRRYPFTIILKRPPSDGVIEPLRFKADPGSKTTGIALVKEVVGKTPEVVFAANLEHRGQQIKASLDARCALRRGRRNRKTRYRKARFLNRRKPEGWLAPSLMHRVYTVMTWFDRLRKFAPVSAISMELVKFDTQAMQNPEISGVEYQQGELAGYEVREYLLEKFNRQCVYCNAKNVPLQIEHVHAKAKGGTNRVSNLVIACEPCNTKKNTTDIKVFLAKDPERLKRILAQAKSPLKDAAAVNATRWAIFNALKNTGLPVETGTGGRTKFNRTKQQFPKDHWSDAACVGESGAHVNIPEGTKPLLIHATGHGSRQMCQTDKFGFPKAHRRRVKKHFGFQTGDIGRAFTKAGTFVGRIVCRLRPSFKVGIKDGINPKNIRCLQRNDGYAYA